MYLPGSNIQGIVSQKSIVKTLYGEKTLNGMSASVSTQKLFHTIVVHCKPPMEKIGICY